MRERVREAGPQRGTTGAVPDRTRQHRRDDVVDLLGSQRHPPVVDPHDEVTGRRSPPLLERTRDHDREPGVALEPRDLVGLDRAGPDLRHEVAERHLHHRLFAERGQHLRDVPEVGAAGADDQHFGPREVAVVEEEERRPVQPDRGLARPRASLHREHAGERGPDHLVLLHLDGGDDVEHLAGAGPLQLGEQRVRRRAGGPRRARPRGRRTRRRRTTPGGGARP